MTVPSATDFVNVAPGFTAGVAIPFNYPLHAATEIEVYYGPDETLAVLNTHYIVGLTPPNYANATVTPLAALVTAANGNALYIQRATPVTQPVAIPAADKMPERTIESMFDRLTMMMQGVKNTLSRTLRFSVFDGAQSVLPSPTNRANKLLGFDDDGDFALFSTVAESIIAAQEAAAQAAASAALAASIVAGLSGAFLTFSTLTDALAADLTGVTVNNIYVLGNTLKNDGGRAVWTTRSAPASPGIEHKQLLDGTWIELCEPLIFPQMLTGTNDQIASAAFRLGKPLFMQTGTALLQIAASDTAAGSTDGDRHDYLKRACMWQQSCVFNEPARVAVNVTGWFKVAAKLTSGFDLTTINVRAGGKPLFLQATSTVERVITGITYGGRNDNTYAVTIGVSTALGAQVVPGYPLGCRNPKGDNDARAARGGFIVETIAVDRLSFTSHMVCPRVVDLTSPTTIDAAADVQLGSRIIECSGAIGWNTTFTNGSEILVDADGVKTDFDYNFLIEDTEAMQVFTVDPMGAETELTKFAITHKPFNWDVVGLGDNDFGVGHDHYVTYPLVGSPLAAGWKLKIRRLLEVWTGADTEGYINVLDDGNAKFSRIALGYQGITGGHKDQDGVTFYKGSYLEFESCSLVGAGDKVVRGYGESVVHLNQSMIGGGNTAQEGIGLQSGARSQQVRTCTGGFHQTAVTVGDNSYANCSTQLYASATTGIKVTGSGSAATIIGSDIEACVIGMNVDDGNTTSQVSTNIKRCGTAISWAERGFHTGDCTFGTGGDANTIDSIGPADTSYRGGGWYRTALRDLRPAYGEIIAMGAGTTAFPGIGDPAPQPPHDPITQIMVKCALTGNDGVFIIEGVSLPNDIYWMFRLDIAGTVAYTTIGSAGGEVVLATSAQAITANSGKVTLSIYSDSGTPTLQIVNNDGANRDIRWKRLTGDINIGTPVFTYNPA